MDNVVRMTPYLVMKELDVLQAGDKLMRLSSGAPISVVSAKEAPEQWRLRDERDNTYFNVSRESMTYYGWRLPEDRV